MITAMIPRTKRRAILPLLFTISLGLAIIGCKKKASSPCEQARDLQVELVKKFGAPIKGTIKNGKVQAAEPNPEATKKFEAQLERIKAEFVPVCEEIGAEKVLACVKGNAERVGKSPTEKVSEECAAVFATFKERIK